MKLKQNFENIIISQFAYIIVNVVFKNAKLNCKKELESKSKAEKRFEYNQTCIFFMFRPVLPKSLYIIVNKMQNRIGLKKLV